MAAAGRNGDHNNDGSRSDDGASVDNDDAVSVADSDISLTSEGGVEKHNGRHCRFNEQRTSSQLFEHGHSFHFGSPCPIVLLLFGQLVRAIDAHRLPLTMACIVTFSALQ